MNRQMNRRDFLKSSAAVTVSTALSTTAFANAKAFASPKGCGHQADHVWDRPLHTVYAGRNRRFLHNTDKELLNAWDQVQGGITAMTPFLLNVPVPSLFKTMIKAVQSRGTVIVPGVGGPATGQPINSQEYKDTAKAYRDYTDYVRLENTQGFITKRTGDTRGQMQDMIDYLTGTLGFKHVMLNPWPVDSNGVIIPFQNHELDASFNQVQLDFDHNPPYTVHENPTNWMVDMKAVNKILHYRSTVKIVVNYESAPQHEALLQMELDKPGSSERALNITANQCQDDKKNLYWASPFTLIYDPVDLKTWSWEANRLGQMP